MARLYLDWILIRVLFGLVGLGLVPNDVRNFLNQLLNARCGGTTSQRIWIEVDDDSLPPGFQGIFDGVQILQHGILQAGAPTANPGALAGLVGVPTMVIRHGGLEIAGAPIGDGEAVASQVNMMTVFFLNQLRNSNGIQNPGDQH